MARPLGSWQTSGRVFRGRLEPFEFMALETSDAKLETARSGGDNESTLDALRLRKASRPVHRRLKLVSRPTATDMKEKIDGGAGPPPSEYDMVLTAKTSTGTRSAGRAAILVEFVAKGLCTLPRSG